MGSLRTLEEVAAQLSSKEWAERLQRADIEARALERARIRSLGRRLLPES